MKLFNEWMSIRTTQQGIEDWVYVTNSKLEEAKKFLAENGSRLFTTYEIKEEREDKTQVMITIKGSPAVTLFELEDLNIYPDCF